MITTVYWPKCRPITVGGMVACDYDEDSTDIHNVCSCNEPPSYSVRLWGVTYNDCLD